MFDTELKVAQCMFLSLLAIFLVTLAVVALGVFYIGPVVKSSKTSFV